MVIIGLKLYHQAAPAENLPQKNNMNLLKVDLWLRDNFLYFSACVLMLARLQQEVFSGSTRRSDAADCGYRTAQPLSPVASYMNSKWENT